MSNIRILLAAGTILGTGLVTAVLITTATGAPVVVPRFTPIGANAVATPDGVMSVLWLLGEDGRLKVCEGGGKGNLGIVCSAPVQP